MTMHFLSLPKLLFLLNQDDEFSSLEIIVYEEKKNNMFVHHELTLGAFPLCVDWLSVDPLSSVPKSCNYGIVGTFLPEIEIWDLNIVNTLEPVLILGDANPKSKSKTKKKKGISHTDAVVCLQSHFKRKNLLISGSSDTTSILWDLSQGKGLHQYSFNKERINSVQWHPIEEPFCLSSSLSGVNIFDTRKSEAAVSFNHSAQSSF